MIEIVEVGNNDRHRQGDRQHAGNGTQGPYYFSPHTYWPIREKKKKKERDANKGATNVKLTTMRCTNTMKTLSGDSRFVSFRPAVLLKSTSALGADLSTRLATFKVF